MPEKYGKTTVVKSDLIDNVYKAVGFTRQEASEAVEILFDQIKLALGRGEDVRVTGFASFYIRNKKARTARNPKTGEPVFIQEKKALSFKPSKQLLLSTNNSRNDS
ncbi:MAG: integration host factor subunit alpha [Nitrospinales bacterium]